MKLNLWYNNYRLKQKIRNELVYLNISKELNIKYVGEARVLLKIRLPKFYRQMTLK